MNRQKMTSCAGNRLGIRVTDGLVRAGPTPSCGRTGGGVVTCVEAARMAVASSDPAVKVLGRAGFRMGLDGSE
jgi:hypothetical protein